MEFKSQFNVIEHMIYHLATFSQLKLQVLLIALHTTLAVCHAMKHYDPFPCNVIKKMIELLTSPNDGTLLQ